MHLLGLQRLTLLDYPGQIACTVFTGGCNLRCPFCHNSSLVYSEGEVIPTEDFFAFLDSRVGRLEGVCVSGGEPTLWQDLPEFLKKIKEKGFLVKLDTNGTKPEVIEGLISSGLVDYIAMDIKNSPEKYALTVGDLDFDYTSVMHSIEIIENSSVPHEFRTTVTAELHSPEDIRRICANLHRDTKYYIQAYRDEGDILKKGHTAPTKDELEALLLAAREFLPGAEIR